MSEPLSACGESMSKDDDLVGAIVITAAALIAAAVIASLLSNSSPSQRQNSDYLQRQLNKPIW
jgi:hypothetical protein